MKRILTGLLALALLALPAAAAEVESGSTYCFSPGDFSEEEIAGICVTGLPEGGTVLLGDREIRPGDILTAEQVARMTFAPAQTETDTEASMTYLPIYPDRVEAAATMAIQVIGRQNKAPVAEDSGIETYKNLPNEGRLKAEDPEGEALTFTVTRQPKRGAVTIRPDGSFIYEPKKNKVGVDSFTYTAADPAGNVSREATVTITILKPTDATQYTDTAGESCRFAAEWMKNTGIFTGETLGGNGCFGPNKTVSQGEFLTMLVSALEIKPDDAVLTVGTDEAPDWLKPYLAAAMRSGLTAGWPDGAAFAADQPITGAEAAVMLQNALDLTAPADAQAGEDVPVWAADAITVLAANGITLAPGENLTRAQAAMALYQTTKLALDAPGMVVLRRMQ